MNEIKFRAWDTHEEVMNRVDYVDFVSGVIGMSNENVRDYEQPIHRVNIMQYTGLKDKDGVEIFEGDVLYHPLQGTRKVFYPYSDRVASYGLREISTGFGSTLQDAHAVWQVIGNIYQNPELLKVAE